MENNEIMNRLLQEDSTVEQKKTEQVNKQTKQGELPISRIRVVTAKYKVYIVLLLIFICVLLFERIPSTKDAYKSTTDSYNTARTKLTAIQDGITKAENDMAYLGDIISNEQSLKTCLNEKKKDACLNLPESWMKGDENNKQYDLSVPLSYLQLHSLYNKKMPVDEKKVLKNLNEYLIKQDMDGNTRTKVGDILKISIGDPEPKGDNHFYEVPVDVTIEFTTIGDLTGFLYNVEKKLIDNGADRILYKIQSITYDVVSRDEAQTTDISMLAYYYHDERFENIDEEAQTNVNNVQNQSEELENEYFEISTEQTETQESKSFFKKIFNV